MRALCKGQLQALNLSQERALYLLEAKFFFLSAGLPTSLCGGLAAACTEASVSTGRGAALGLRITACPLRPSISAFYSGWGNPGWLLSLVSCSQAVTEHLSEGCGAPWPPQLTPLPRRAGTGSGELGSALTSRESAGLGMVAGWWVAGSSLQRNKM